VGIYDFHTGLVSLHFTGYKEKALGAGGREEYCLETSYCEGTGEDELQESKS